MKVNCLPVDGDRVKVLLVVPGPVCVETIVAARFGSVKNRLCTSIPIKQYAAYGRYACNGVPLDGEC
jgi:hypothetical protein